MKGREFVTPAQDLTELISLIPNRRPGEFSVRLNGFPEPRFIGTIAGNTYRKRISRDSHILRNAGSIAICSALIHHPDIEFTWISVDVDGQKFVTTRSFLAAHGIVFHYARYEPQLALPLPMWGKHKAEEWEAIQAKQDRLDRERRAQLSLFEGGEAA